MIKDRSKGAMDDYGYQCCDELSFLTDDDDEKRKARTFF